MSSIAIILAAGRSARFGTTTPKQYCKINGLTLIEKSIQAFESLVDHIQVVIHPDDQQLYDELKLTSVLPVIYGGARRQDSTKIALEHLASLNPTKVLIHDAARAFLEKDLVKKLLHELENHKAIIPASKCSDTIKQVKDSNIITTLDRNQLYRAQTPQAFDYQTILNGHRKISQDATDDAFILEQLGIPVKIIESTNSNYKITYQEDMMQEYETRVGMGYDAHKFKINESENYITMAGIKIPHSKSIDAHSDGDVLLHSLTDAILGAIAEKDIGVHFPDTDSKWMGADSAIFTKYACDLVTKKSGTLINVDITIIAEKPKFVSYRDAMIENLAKILNLSSDRINIKATTTEKMGFTGREEGIAVQSVVSVRI